MVPRPNADSLPLLPYHAQVAPTAASGRGRRASPLRLADDPSAIWPGREASSSSGSHHASANLSGDKGSVTVARSLLTSLGETLETLAADNAHLRAVHAEQLEIIARFRASERCNLQSGSAFGPCSPPEDRLEKSFDDNGLAVKGLPNDVGHYSLSSRLNLPESARVLPAPVAKSVEEEITLAVAPSISLQEIARFPSTSAEVGDISESANLEEISREMRHSTRQTSNGELDVVSLMSRGGPTSGIVEKRSSTIPAQSVQCTTSPMEARLRKSQFATGEEESNPFCVLNPMGLIRFYWDVVWFSLLMFDFWLTPFLLVFASATMMVPESITTINWVATSFFCCDIVLNFFTGYVDDDETMVMNHRRIARHYLGFWFWIDILATVPFDEIVAKGEMAQTARAARVSKAAKILKMVKMLRVVKMVKHVRTFWSMKKKQDERKVQRQQKRAAKEWYNDNRHCWLDLTSCSRGIRWISSYSQYAVKPLEVFFFIVVMAHLHGCLWGSYASPPAENFYEALREYWQCFGWAYSVMVFGEAEQAADTSELLVIKLLLVSERIGMVVAGLVYTIFRALTYYEDDAGMTQRRTHALKYMSSHEMNGDTQLQVLHCLNETGNSRKMQRHFNELMANEIPLELRQTVCEELWSAQLQSLGLIEHVVSWSGPLLKELVQLVREESYSSKVAVFREGDAANACYKVLDGKVVVTSSLNPGDVIPPFTAGQWVGEKALVNPSLRRSGTMVTHRVSTLMVVPADKFHELLEHFDITTSFNEFCSEQLWRGLCGRCGMIGSHFVHECPLLRDEPRSPKRGAGPGKSSKKFDGGESSGFGIRKLMRPVMTSSDSLRPESLANDLKLFLADRRLEHLSETLLGLDVFDLAGLEAVHIDLCNFDSDAVKRSTSDSTLYTSERDELFVELKKVEKAISPSAIQEFRRKQAGTMKMMLRSVKRNHHFLFLSHYKIEAGTEASLMRTELERLMRDDAGHPANGLETPVFLDSEDLTDLEDLKERVRQSHNLALLLTRAVLLRPWVLVELVTALRAGVQVLLVSVDKPGNEFAFPDQAFYVALLDGSLLGKAGVELLAQYDVTLEEVASALRQIFARISLPYSPHKSADTRLTEIRALLKQCKVRDIDNQFRPGGPAANSPLDVV